MRGDEHTVFLFFSEFSKTPVVNQMIKDHKAMYNLFGSVVYYTPHSILKSKSYEFHNRNICLLSGIATKMAGYFIEMHRDLRKRKALPAKFSST